ncbi:hypothetical protein Tco_1489574, partial [Tanacetum coccineum]
DPLPRCKDHGPQSTSVYSDQANTLTRDCNELLAELSNKDPHELSSTLKDLEGEHQPEATQPSKPLSPALSITASNQPEVAEPETAKTKEFQSTPPTTHETTKPVKGGQPSNLPKSSTIKNLFKTDPHVNSSEGTKKTKYDK